MCVNSFVRLSKRDLHTLQTYKYVNTREPLRVWRYADHAVFCLHNIGGFLRLSELSFFPF